jgi:hypothetical protein
MIWQDAWLIWKLICPLARTSASTSPFFQASHVITTHVITTHFGSERSKASRTSASTSPFFQASHVITTRDALEEFVAANIWPCQPWWGSWAFKTQMFPGLDHQV